MTRKEFTPREYQRLIFDHINNLDRCAVWADMGLGKTVASLTAIDAAHLAGESHPTLIVAPLIVARDTWPDEARKWQHLSALDVMPVIGRGVRRGGHSGRAAGRAALRRRRVRREL
mgnify:CR=1 FL=1